MTDWNEQLAYFLVLAQLLDEAELQLEADADTPAALFYADELDRLRSALATAFDSAAAIVERVQQQRQAPPLQQPNLKPSILPLTH